MSAGTPDPGEPGDDDARSPDWEALGDADRVSEAQWAEVLAGYDSPAAVNSEVPADLVADELAAGDDWERPDPPPVGWRTAPRALVLSLIAVLGAIAGLLVGALFFRPMPGWLTLLLVVVMLGGGVQLFRSLPSERRRDGDDGAAV
ncbi:hypothetical protein GSY69_09785 [Brevibacterium sp. 5221]|uniref:Uncharacterized protein n=1 Tax=Brevibacterium rongguiense TaxID=2695267 RepID=A0A6N9H862_9MICO|nr:MULTISPECIES: hypothetical protein [Brevibacterium]MYM20247.1 hypothetical protein [Brevibacterium rongguiense]WAL40748.1 hypothetical protein BRM1_02425 [Brevibacterium sp. BRM-1]